MEIGTSLDISYSIVDTLLFMRTELTRSPLLVLTGIGLIRSHCCSRPKSCTSEYNFIVDLDSDVHDYSIVIIFHLSLGLVNLF